MALYFRTSAPTILLKLGRGMYCHCKLIAEIYQKKISAKILTRCEFVQRVVFT